MAWRGLNWLWLKPKKIERLLRQQGLSGNTYRFLTGDAIDMFRMRTQARLKPMEFSNDISYRVEPFLHQIIKKYGKNSFAWFSTIPVVVITEAELAKDVLSRISDFSRLNIRALKLIAPGIGSYEGEKWVKHRKIINPGFHIEKLKQMIPAFPTSCIEMMSKWEKLVTQTGSVELDVWPHFTCLTGDVISRAAFGSSYEEGREAFKHIEEQIEVFSKNTLEFILPGLRNLPTRANRRFYKAQKGIESIIKSVIGKRRNKMEADETDLLGLLMSCNVRITTEELIDECKLFYAAGHETTSVLLTFTILMLSKYTNWQAKARDEVLKTFGQNLPDFEGLNHLKTVTMILYEVLRLYPPVPTTPGCKVLCFDSY